MTLSETGTGSLTILVVAGLVFWMYKMIDKRWPWILGGNQQPVVIINPQPQVQPANQPAAQNPPAGNPPAGGQPPANPPVANPPAAAPTPTAARRAMQVFVKVLLWSLVPVGIIVALGLAISTWLMGTWAFPTGFRTAEGAPITLPSILENLWLVVGYLIAIAIVGGLLLYFAYKAYKAGGGKWSARLGYLTFALLFLGGAAWLILGPQRATGLGSHVINSIRDGVDEARGVPSTPVTARPTRLVEISPGGGNVVALIPHDHNIHTIEPTGYKYDLCARGPNLRALVPDDAGPTIYFESNSRVGDKWHGTWTLNERVRAALAQLKEPLRVEFALTRQGAPSPLICPNN